MKQEVIVIGSEYGEREIDIRYFDIAATFDEIKISILAWYGGTVFHVTKFTLNGETFKI